MKVLMSLYSYLHSCKMIFKREGHLYYKSVKGVSMSMYVPIFHASVHVCKGPMNYPAKYKLEKSLLATLMNRFVKGEEWITLG